jgi:hypothetical protein
MSKSSRHFFGFLAATTLIFFAPVGAAHAATDIQMLPPLLGVSPVTGDAPTCPPGSSRLLTWDGTNPIGCTPQISVDQRNNLTVGGSAQVGNNTSSCTSVNAGSIRWTGTEFDGCNGTNWQSLSIQQGTNIAAFKNPGTYTWTVPSGVTRIEIEVWGGGGGASGGIGGTGGGGGYADGFYAVTPNSTYSVMVGAGGVAAMYPAFGGDGGSSAVVSLIGATGGHGGNAGAGTGGVGVLGQLNINGGDGVDLGGSSDGNTYGGVPGGAAPRGGPGGGVLGSGGSGNDGQQPGGGGGGTSVGGGSGAAGEVVIRY